MDTRVCKPATTLIIMVLLFRQAEGVERYKRAPSLGDVCVEDIDCTVYFGNQAECITRQSGAGECGCRKGAHFKDGRCYETALIGQKCTVNNNCQLANGQPAYCVKSVCTCQNGYQPNQDGTECIRIRQLDEPCDTDVECVANNSRCGYVCRCRVNYIQSRQKDECLKAADRMGDPCQENEQCSMFLSRAVCDATGQCSCSTGFHHIPPYNKCYPSIGLGEMCEDNAECVVPSAVCSEGRCECEPSFTASADNSQCNVADNNGQKAVLHSWNVLLVTLTLPTIVQYLDAST